jgi:hypothetical protein
VARLPASTAGAASEPDSVSMGLRCEARTRKPGADEVSTTGHGRPAHGSSSIGRTQLGRVPSAAEKNTDLKRMAFLLRGLESKQPTIGKLPAPESRVYARLAVVSGAMFGSLRFFGMYPCVPGARCPHRCVRNTGFPQPWRLRILCVVQSHQSVAVLQQDSQQILSQRLGHVDPLGSGAPLGQ